MGTTDTVLTVQAKPVPISVFLQYYKKIIKLQLALGSY